MNGQRATLITTWLLAAGLCWPQSAAGQAPVCPAPASIAGDFSLPMSAVRYLADDALEGRLAGSPGERCAAEFIAAEFRRLGLAPAGDDGSFFQEVPLASVLNPHTAGGTGRNVLAAFAGRDPVQRNEWVVIGAHYDHLGTGAPGSLAPESHAIHNGADDNASGVAAMLGAAARLVAGSRPARSVLFVAFTGEESGLLGSAYFTASPLAPQPMDAMINLDMVGRLGAGPLITYGVGTAEEWMAVLDPAAARAGLTLATERDGYGPSDHTSFYTKDIPVLHFFTNTHGDYHRPTDDWQKIDAPGLERISGLVAEVAAAVANRDRPLTLVRGAGEPPRQGVSLSGSDAYLGTVPDFTPVERGVKLGGVTSGSPASNAGLQAGDVIVGIGEHDVADLQGMTDALRAHKPGDTVTVRFLRSGEERTVQATLGSRAAR